MAEIHCSNHEHYQKGCKDCAYEYAKHKEAEEKGSVKPGKNTDKDWTWKWCLETATIVLQAQADAEEKITAKMIADFTKDLHNELWG